MLSKSRRALAAMAVVLVPLLGIVPAAYAEPPANASFMETWQRTDFPVAEGQAIRTWMWGPEAFTGELVEDYAESPGGARSVQYFDKSRMEITDPNDDSNSIWYVTNGLLVVELITGQLQVGDSEFEERLPARINVAGDADDPNGPTYATFAGVLDQGPHAVGESVAQRIGRSGSLIYDAALADQGITIATIDDVTNHAIAAPFWDFMNSGGTIYQDGGFTSAPLFENAYFATGRPIAEPAWTNVLVGGEEKLVLIQCFERRCLTYTPDNAPEWQVEAGNVGRHYYAWRYEDDDSGSTPPGSDATPECQLAGFPCTLAETPVDALANMFEVGTGLAGILRGGGTIQDVVAQAQSQSSVVEVIFDDDAVRFRVDRAPPAWVYDDSLADESDPSSLSFTQHNPTSEIRPDEVAGKDRDEDGMTDEKPKRALILSPFFWQLGSLDPGASLEGMLAEVPDYEGQVERHINTKDSEGNIQRQVTLDMFAGWNSYDVVHVTTHGKEICRELNDGGVAIVACNSTISTGYYLTEEEAAAMDVFGARISFTDGPESDGGDSTVAKLSLTADFFLWTYPTGLDNVILFLNACESFPTDYDHELVVSGDLPRQLSGLGGVVIGWDKSVRSDDAARYALEVYTEAIERGVPVEDIVREVSSRNGPATHTHNGSVVSPYLRAYVGDDDLRIREVVRQLHPLTRERVEDGHALPIIGQFGDGQDDRLPFVLEIDGVEDQQGFEIHARIDGEDRPETFSLANATQVSDTKYRLERVDVPLGFDATENQTIELRFWVSLPEGGETKHTVNVRLANPILDFHSVIDSSSGVVDLRSEVHAEFTLVFNDDFSKFEVGATTLDYVAYDVTVHGTGCESQTTLHDGTLEITGLDFPTGADGRISSFVPNEVRLRPLNDIYADLTIVCPQGAITIPGLDIHWYSGWVVAHGGEGGSGGGVDEFDEADGVWVISDWQQQPPHKEYDQTIPLGDVTLYETTRLEITMPEE